MTAVPMTSAVTATTTERPALAGNDLTLTTDDGVALAARVFEPSGRARGAVLIVSAMGVPQSFYAPLATWLARDGFLAMTFDYRGSGLSRRGSRRAVDADIVTWAERDAAAALDAIAERAAGLPITWIGHSLGGQILPFVPGFERVAKVITIATGSGYWKQNAPALKRKVWLFWYAFVPVLTPLFGYFPGRRLGMVGDLPRGVVRQWRKWCFDKDYAAGAEGPAVRARFAAITTPITSLSFSDDEMMSRASIDSIHGHYTGAPRTMRRIEPSALGLARVGHFGFFRREMEQPQWQAELLPELAQAS